MKIIGFVPIKLNNSRFPGKNLMCFDDGMPLLRYFLEKLCNIKMFDKLYVFCSQDISRKYIPEGVELLKRPNYLDNDEATPQKIILEFIKRVDADVYAVCHCTSPFVKETHLKDCISMACSEKFDSAFTAVRLQKLLWSDNKPLNFNPTQIPRTQDLPIIYTEVSAAYVFKKETFLKYNRRIGMKPYICTVDEVESIDIDYESDFIIANSIYMYLKKEWKK